MATPRVPPLTPWRIGRGWLEPEIQAQLAALAVRPASRAAEPPAYPDLTSTWTVERFRALLGDEPPGLPLASGPFARVARAIQGYRFADPRITHGHFDRTTPLLGRDILVETRVLFIRMLVGLRIGEVIDWTDATESRFGIRLDTLAGHVLDGAEWIEVAKDHQTGTIWLHIGVHWRPGRLPNWWMRLGFWLFGRTVQARWRRQAVRRLRAFGA